MPIDLIEEIDGLKLSKIKQQKTIRFLDLLMNKSIEEHGSMFAYVPFSANLFRKVFNSRYREFIKPLLDANIVLCDEKFSGDTGKVMYYRVNPGLIDNMYANWETTVKYTYDYVNELKEERFFKGFETFYNSLEIDYGELYHTIDDYVYNISDSDLKVNYTIPEGRHPILYESGEIKYQYRDRAIKEACKQGKELILDGGKYYIDSVKDYLSSKKHRIMLSYTQTVKNLEQGNIYAKRNKTNFRFDHNFTTFPKILLNLIIQQNGLEEIDATNSQYAILGNMLKDTVYDGYVQDSTGGVLYEQVQNVLGCDRDTAKSTMMQVVYAKPSRDYMKKEKEEIRALYPEMMAYVDDFKVSYDYKELPVSMQKKEVEIYVDGVLDRLYNLGINCITKHDSVIFYEKDREIVKSVLDEVLSEKNYILNLS